MKSIKINLLLVAGTVAGLMYGGSLFAQGVAPIANTRQCARQLCYDLRNCNGGGDNFVEKAKAKKSGEQAQGGEGSCHQLALWSYYGCIEGGGWDGVKPQDPAGKPKTTNKTKTSQNVD
ncbi:MAG: hypothetical protein EHM43_01405 [Ignavibacteriae bacterium]|nr:MAG: hypothetical protein EHM43_01405 [Ignavibacteriota bacterium]